MLMFFFIILRATKKKDGVVRRLRTISKDGVHIIQRDC